MLVNSWNAVQPSGSDPMERALDSILKKPCSRSERRVLLKALRRLGADNVQKLQAGGVKLHIHDPLNLDAPAMRASYVPAKKLLVMSPGRMTLDDLLHEFGHALDDLAAPDPAADKPVLLSERCPEVHQIYTQYVDRCQEASWWQNLWGAPRWSDYATTTAQEYVAEGVMRFTRSDRSREKLEEVDPRLCGYLQKLLKPGPPPGNQLDQVA